MILFSGIDPDVRKRKKSVISCLLVAENDGKCSGIPCKREKYGNICLLQIYISHWDMSCPAAMALRMMVDEMSTISAFMMVMR